MTLKNIYTLLFFTGLFFIPFNDFSGVPAFGEFKDEAASFFFLAGFALLVVSGRLTMPSKSPYFQLLVIFLLWCIVATALNAPTVLENYFKQTSGISRFIRQYFSLILSTFIFFIFYWNIIRSMAISEILFKIRKLFLFSLLFVSVYGLLEAMVVVFHINAARHVLSIFEYFPFLAVKYSDGRISSVAAEPPFLAIYLITVAGWMFSFVLTETSRLKFVPMVLVIVLTYFSGSRTALLVIAIQLAIFFAILYRSPQYKKYITYIAMFAGFSVITLLAVNAEKVIHSVQAKLESLDFEDNLKNNISNQSRFGLQYAALQVFKQNPVAGVGYGQQTYQARFFYPRWATKDNYEFRAMYSNPAEKSFPPGYNLYIRLLAETGLIGTGLFVFFLYVMIKRTQQLAKERTGDERILAIILLISFTGLAVNWLQSDTFRIYGFWISAAILIRISSPAYRNVHE